MTLREAKNALIPTRAWSKIVDVATGRTRTGRKAVTVRLRREDRTWTVTSPSDISDLIEALTEALGYLEEKP